MVNEGIPCDREPQAGGPEAAGVVVVLEHPHGRAFVQQGPQASSVIPAQAATQNIASISMGSTGRRRAPRYSALQPSSRGSSRGAVYPTSTLASLAISLVERRSTWRSSRVRLEGGGRGSRPAAGDDGVVVQEVRCSAGRSCNPGLFAAAKPRFSSLRRTRRFGWRHSASRRYSRVPSERGVVDDEHLEVGPLRPRVDALECTSG